MPFRRGSSRVRTLAYVANRADWLADPESWRGRARALEDRLSDTLHEQLMQRFIDRRTSALMRSLNAGDGPILAGVGADGAVTVEGHFVGKLAGVSFDPARGATALENRALRGAVERAVAPEVARRLGQLAAEDDEAFALAPDGMVLWRGRAAGQLAGGDLFSPKVRLLGDFGAVAARERAARRLEAFVAAEVNRCLPVLSRLKAAVAEGRLKGLARGLAYQLIEQFGVLDRRKVETLVRALSQKERRTLKALGVRFGAFSLYLPALTSPQARGVCAAFAALALPDWRPAVEGLSVLPRPEPPPEALALRGLCAVAGLAAPVMALERLDALARAASPELAGAILLTPEILADLGWAQAQAERILRALGFAPARKGVTEAPTPWRRRPRAAEAAPADAGASAFAALAAITAPAPRGRRKRVRRRSGARGLPA